MNTEMDRQTPSTSAATTVTQTLAGRTIVITRALAQSFEFAAELESRGARVIACPTIEIVAPESYAALDEAIEHLYGYDWLIFTSVNGVDYFVRRFAQLGRDVSELDELKVCAIGEATADRLRDVSVHVDLVPEQFKAEGVFAALESYLGGHENLRGLNFLIPRAAVARDYLPRALEEAGARAAVVAAYRTVRPQMSAANWKRCLRAAALIASPSPVLRRSSTSLSFLTPPTSANCSPE
ncbi:MAG: uroporphyrinogen-III synthase [Pyrinomonadaceae bacterium]